MYIGSPRRSMDNLLDLLSEFGKIAEYKINKQKSVIFLDKSNKENCNDRHLP